MKNMTLFHLKLLQIGKVVFFCNIIFLAMHLITIQC